MILKQKLIENIGQLSPNDLIAVHNFIQTLTRRTKNSSPKMQSGHLKTREALASCQGNLSEDIVLNREERI